MNLLTRLLERTEHVKQLREEMDELSASLEYWMRRSGEHEEKLFALEYPAEPEKLPYCVKCNQGRKRGQGFTELTFIHDHCPSDNACEVSSAKLPESFESESRAADNPTTGPFPVVSTGMETERNA